MISLTLSSNAVQWAGSKQCQTVLPLLESCHASTGHPHKRRRGVAARDNEPMFQCLPRSTFAGVHRALDVGRQTDARPAPPTLARMAKSSSGLPLNPAKYRAAIARRRSFHSSSLLHFTLEKGRLKFIKSRVKAFDLIVVFLFRPIVSQCPHPIRQLRVICGDRAGIAECAKIFARIKTMPSRMAQRTGPPAFVPGSLRLRAVFDDFQPVFPGQVHNRVHVRRLAVKMHRHDGFGSRRDCGLNTVRDPG